MKHTRGRIALVTLLAAALALPAGAVAAQAKPKPKRVAFVSWRYEDPPRGATPYRARIVTMKPNGQGKKIAKQIVTPAHAKVFSSAQLSPDGKRLLFTKGDAPEEGTIWVARASGKRPKRIVKVAGGIAYAASWSPNGKSIAYLATKGQSTTLVVAKANGKKRQVRAKAGAWKLFGPTWSPDGKKILFSAPGAGSGTLRVATVKSKGGKQVKYLTPGNEHWRAGGYAPSGKRIVLNTLALIRTPRMAEIAAGRGTAARWGPGSRAVYYYNVFTMKANGKGLKKKVSSVADDVTGRATYSPDGKQILAPRQVGGDVDIFSIPIGGGTWKRLTTEGGTSMFDLNVLDYSPS